MYLSIFSPNAVKHGPEKTPYLDTFYAVAILKVPHNTEHKQLLKYY